MNKIVTIVGARPQFIKVAAVSRVLRSKFKEVLIHTGQHYDYNMSEIFFNELEIPKPDYNLGIYGGTHGEMTGKMIIEIENVLIIEKPDLVLLYGDTNSTMAGAISAAKLCIPVCHIEAGNRLGTLNNPEEVNRIVTDHVSTLFMCCTKSSVNFLRKEGKMRNVWLVGDPMYDAFCYYSINKLTQQFAKIVNLEGQKIDIPKQFYYLTCHREENTKSDIILKEILEAMNALEQVCIYPVHPRNQNRVNNLNKTYRYNNIIFCKPVGYLTSLFLIKNCIKVVTDSGGLQREAFFASKQCVTVFDYVGWPETMAGNCNQLARPIAKDIINKLNVNIDREQFNNLAFGDGHSAEKIVNILQAYFEMER